MSDIKCLSNKDNKAYVIPTNKWLKPIKPLFNISSDADIILAKLVDKEEVLVRITKNSNNKLEIINNNLSKLDNFPFVYCIIRCTESFDILDNNYLINDKPVNGFCNGTKNDEKITLEIMKYYKKNYIEKFLDKKTEIDTIKLFLDQLISAQLLAFQHYGFVHGDIHKGNIIITKEDFSYKYEFDKKLFYKPIAGKNNFKLYIIDFGNSDFLLSEYRSQYLDDYYDDTKKERIPKREYREKINTLPQNIYNTFITLFELLNDNDRKKLMKILENHKTEGNPTLDHYNHLFFKAQSRLFYNCDKYNNNIFMKNALSKTILMVNRYYLSLFGEYYITGFE